MTAMITEDIRKRVLYLLSRQGRRDDIEDALQEACLRYYTSAP